MSVESATCPSDSKEVWEALRQCALRARHLGYAVPDVAAILGVGEETVSQWCSGDAASGTAALSGLCAGAAGPSTLVALREGSGGPTTSSVRAGGAGSSASPVPFNAVQDS
jgi:hypothetical protein